MGGKGHVPMWTQWCHLKLSIQAVGDLGGCGVLLHGLRDRIERSLSITSSDHIPKDGLLFCLGQSYFLPSYPLTTDVS